MQIEAHKTLPTSSLAEPILTSHGLLFIFLCLAFSEHFPIPCTVYRVGQGRKQSECMPLRSLPVPGPLQADISSYLDISVNPSTSSP